MPPHRLVRLLLIPFLICTGIYPAAADTSISPALTGMPGLNTIPNARHAPRGNITAYSGLADPYLHAGVGIQLADPLHIFLRQTAETGDLFGETERLYPGVDVKIRLRRESEYGPAVSLGLQSAMGHKRLAGEYLSFSKRYHDFDFTAGVGWGRLGSAGHVGNPFKILGSHFSKDRPRDGESPNDIHDWFTGDKIGLFGGFEYTPSFLPPPFNDISLKADWGADRFLAEKLAGTVSDSDPWALGLNYQPTAWAQIGLSANSVRVGGSLTLKSPVQKWPGRMAKNTSPPPVPRQRATRAAADKAADVAALYDLPLSDVVTHDKTIRATLTANDLTPLPQQLGRAARILSAQAGPDTETISIEPAYGKLKGPNLKFLRADFISREHNHPPSPPEIWHNTLIRPQSAGDGKTGKRTNKEPVFLGHRGMRLVWDNQISLSEEDSGLLYRTGLIAEVRHIALSGFLSGAAVRLDLENNLSRLDEIRPRLRLPTRGNIDEFADDRFGLDQLYSGYAGSISPSWHGIVAAGYLEEMYSGFGGEILYRPYRSRLAAGIDLWQVFKRDPQTTLNTGLTGDSLLTGHINLWYDLPRSSLTLKVQAGRYLAEDIGGTITLKQDFENGLSLQAFATATDQADFDLFGGTTHIYSGLTLKAPLGNVPFIPRGSLIKTELAPVGRNTGQTLDKPVTLHGMTNRFSYRHIADTWHKIDE